MTDDGADADAPVVHVEPGDGPIVLGMPHTGIWLPADALATLNDRGRALTDTDWHVHKLYAGLLPGATTVRALFHRYVVDANRAADDSSLYPGRNTTALLPTTDFDGEPIRLRDVDPTMQRRWVERFHRGYHERLAAELERARVRHGVAILYDCHSIRSSAPWLFEGTLPDFNIGDADGASCDPRVTRAVTSHCAAADGYSHVVNGRFKGGWTTRHYGRPDTGLHAIQMELAQSAYLEREAPPWRYDEDRAARLRETLGAILVSLEALAPTLVPTRH